MLRAPLISVLFVLSRIAAAGEMDTEPLKLIPPWTPVVANADAVGVEVGVWGRTLKFANQALPTSIVAAGEEILAAPMRLVGQTAGKPIAWKTGGSLLFGNNADAAVVSGWQAGDQLVVNATTRVEFDGMMRVDLVVMPQSGAEPKLERLWLEVPLKSPRATLFHYWPGTWGAANNSGAVPDAGMALSFKPFVWLGWEAGGLGWFSESDQYWQPRDPKTTIEIVPGGEETVLRLRLLDSSPPRLPWTITFGFQPTPVKPWRTDFHEWRIQHGIPFDIHSRPVQDGSQETELDRAVKLGVKTFVLHEGWTPYEAYPATTYDSELKALLAACHERGVKLLLYHGYLLSTLAPEWGAMSDEVLVKDEAGSYTGMFFRLPPQTAFTVCCQSRWRDFLRDGIALALDRYGYDGVYLDGTIEPFACANEKHGCGYRGADGTMHSTYPIFAVRRLMHDLAALVRPRNGLVNVHQSTCCVTPTLAFADSYWDGEQFQGGELAHDATEQLPLAAFRAEFMGRNFGVPAEFLVYERPPHWTFDDALALTMLHDVRVRPAGDRASLEKMSPIWKAMTQFGVGEAAWHPYWEPNPMAAAQPGEVKVSLYASGRKEKSGRALLVVSNLSADKQTIAQVKLDLQRLQIRESGATARDAITGEALALRGEQLTIPLPPMRMRMVWVE